MTHNFSPHFQPYQYTCISLSTDGDEENMFTTGRDTGSVMVARKLDAERKSFYNLTISVTDGVHVVTTQVIYWIFVCSVILVNIQ